MLVSILGTAIGLGLTFTVNRTVENNKLQRAQRETAIMAVCDINEIVERLKDEIRLEDTLFQVAMYVSTHTEQIDSMSADTLDMVFKYLFDNPAEVKEWTIDTKENAFNSGMESRKNLGNNKFYDNVQSCYYARRSMMKTMEKTLAFRRPIRSEDLDGFLQTLGPADMEDDGDPTLHAKRWLMKKVFEEGSTRLYIRRYFSRRNAYLGTIYQLERLNRENKLLLNITNQDIEEYMRQNEETSQAATVDLIVGSWEDPMGDNKQSFVFGADGTVETTLQISIALRMYLVVEQTDVLATVPMTIRMKGGWELKGDSLKVKYDGQTSELLTFDMDTSNFPKSAQERLKDSLEIKKQDARAGLLELFKQQVSTFNINCVASFDRSGNTMILTSQENTPTGQKDTSTRQLFRLE